MNSIPKMLALLAVGALWGAPATATQSDQDCSRAAFQNCLNGVSSSVTNGASLRMTGSHVTEAIEERDERKSSSPAVTTRETSAYFAAGDSMTTSPLGLWASYSFNDFDSDFAFAGTSLAYEADSHNVIGGVDKLLGDRFLLGLSLGYQDASADTFFNGGGQENDGITVAPYFAVLLSDIFSLDVAGGYTSLDYDQFRISPTDGSDTRASFDSDRWFVSGNANAVISRDNWIFGLKLGVTRAEETQDGYTETGSAASAAGRTLRVVRERDIELTQLVVGGDVAYGIGGFEPFFAVAYYNDLDRDDGPDAGGLPRAFTVVQPDDDDEVLLSVGLRYFSSNGLTGTLEYSRVEGREDFHSDSVMVNLRLSL